ncbi:MAG: DEAD/DEAH box helicase [Candidatus Pacebacteria bacterium]|nr:DEAD/DEAH box helicase [Candidatus Paceibacterota bacterium]
MPLKRMSSELSIFRDERFHAEWSSSLQYFQATFENNIDYQPAADDIVLFDVMKKSLCRGPRAFCPYFLEQWIVHVYGTPFWGIEESEAGAGSIRYDFPEQLIGAYNDYTDFVDEWQGDSEDVAFDPEHPENERELFRRLVDRFGRRLAHYVTPQFNLSDILVDGEAGFLGQRGDFLLSFPNGKSLILEPGDHGEDQHIRDAQRDAAFQEQGIRTLRPQNQEIFNDPLYDEIHRELDGIGALNFLEERPRADQLLATNYLILLPALVSKVHYLLLDFFLKRGLIHRENLTIGVVERDLECAELSITSFYEQLIRLSELYGVDAHLPRIRLLVNRNPTYRLGDLSEIQEGIHIENVAGFDSEGLDVLLDVGIKHNLLTPLIAAKNTRCFGSIRRCFPHNVPQRFMYGSRPRAISVTENTDELLASFVQDFFRKKELRDGQAPILHNVLSQKATIGLLPTGAGKSLCYQLAGLLTPGMTIVVSPTTALMDDQVQSLKNQFGIDRVLAWHSGARLLDNQAADHLISNLFLFISPERLLRPQFRINMQGFNAADVFVNYAVIDEAHCVSMWGHDFRPAYLTLEKNFREFCTFQGHSPVVVALTGTASQLVLIDLKRELNIEDLDAIVRPSSFDRPELHFRLYQCPSNQKQDVLRRILNALPGRLNIDSLEQACGIVFAFTPNECWNLLGNVVGNQLQYVQNAIHDDHHAPEYGMYSGSAPYEGQNDHRRTFFTQEEWNRYKNRVLVAFKRGKIRMLFGNAAVGVGIDNEFLNYVVNYKMPQSMEAYYQQCGRAGRSRQHSECVLLFSDDNPGMTQEWLNRNIRNMGERRDDIGTVAYFHNANFPGRDDEIRDAYRVFTYIFREVANAQNGMVRIPARLRQNMNRHECERTEKYLSYWLMLGVVEDYTVEGMGLNTEFVISLHRDIQDYLENRDEQRLEQHFVSQLTQYMSRYRPTTRTRVEQGLEQQNAEHLSQRCISFLVDFIYNEIVYQRRESIRTMVDFCNEEDRAAERLRARINAYFDSSEFSGALLQMAENEPNIQRVLPLFQNVEGFDDAEHLYWETRRLLDERFRVDWAAVNLYAICYRERLQETERFLQALKTMVEGLRAEFFSNGDQCSFLRGIIESIASLRRNFGSDSALGLIAKIFDELWELYRLDYTSIIDNAQMPQEYSDYIHAKLLNQQLREMEDAGGYSRSIG